MGIDRWAASRAGSRVWAQRPMARNNSPRRYSHSGNRRPGSESTTVRRRRAWCWRSRSELRVSLVLRRHLRPLASLIGSRPAFRVALPYISPAAGHRERIAMRHWLSQPCCCWGRQRSDKRSGSAWGRPRSHRSYRCRNRVSRGRRARSATRHPARSASRANAHNRLSRWRLTEAARGDGRPAGPTACARDRDGTTTTAARPTDDARQHMRVPRALEVSEQ